MKRHPHRSSHRFVSLALALGIALGTAVQAEASNPIAGITGSVPKTIEYMDAYSVKDYIRAEAGSRAAMKRDRRDPQHAAINGWSNLGLGNLTAAEQSFQKVIKLDRLNVHGPLGMVWLNIKRNDYAAADEWLIKAKLGVDQVMESTWENTAGWLAFFKGDSKAATKHFGKARAALFFDDAAFISIDRRVMTGWEAAPRVGMGWVHFAAGDLAEAKQSLNNALDYDAACHLCYGALAEIAVAEGKTMEAIRLAGTGLSVSRYDPDLLELLNKQLALKADPQLSLAVYEKITPAAGNVSAYLANLGFARFWTGDYEGAGSAFTQALAGDASGHELAKLGDARVKCVNDRGEAWYSCMEANGVPAR